MGSKNLQKVPKMTPKYTNQAYSYILTVGS